MVNKKIKLFNTWVIVTDNALSTVKYSPAQSDVQWTKNQNCTVSHTRG